MDAEKRKITFMMNRRRFLSVCAMASAFSVMPWVEALSTIPLHRWNGILLGAEVGLTLAHPNKQKANEIFELCVNEIKRLESIFTLYDSHSELAQLNANGVLKSPAIEMQDIIEKSRLYHDMTDGAFDVTVRPLEDGKSFDLVGMENLHVNMKEIRLKKHGMSVTLNGIAQGYITDRITELLKLEGLENILVELGEKRSIGTHPSGRPWLLALQGETEPVFLNNKALATSARQSPNTGAPHIYNPLDGQYAEKHNIISVLADSAAMADALSTGFMCLEKEKIESIQKRYSYIHKVYIS